MATPAEIDELARLDATGQAELIRSGAIPPDAAVRAACRRIERQDGALGAVPIRLFDEAEAALRALSGKEPFAGVPFLMKDVGARQRGQPYYAANRALREADHRATADTPLGARFRELGLVTVGKSSSPEFGLQSNTWPLAYGPTRNPWDRRRAAGGSSGGACAAVSTGLVPVAHASDGAGSIRIPAAWCGLIGLKPTRDRIVWRHAGTGRPDVEFVVARSLRDTAGLLDALRPAEERARAPRVHRSALARAFSPLHVAVCTDSPEGSSVDPEVIDATRALARALEAQGHAVEDDAPAALFEYADRALHGTVLGPVGYRACLDELAARLGRPVTADDVEPFLWELSQLDGEGDVEEALAWNEGWARRMAQFFKRFDLLVTPTVHEPAPPLDALDPRRLSPLELLERMVPHMAFTEPWNATGQPALSLPFARTSRGLPIGVQLVARTGREDTLLAVAASLLDGDPPLASLS